MFKQFGNGYALLIAINENAITDYALPDVAKDIAAVEAILKHEERCAYDPAHVKVLMGKDATRQGIIDGLDWLQDQIRDDASGNATALIYYSGHGWRDENTSPPAYYLIPYDMRPGPIPLRALRGEDFASAVSALTPQRLLVILDACHSGGMGVKDVKPIIGGFMPAPTPAALFMFGAKGAAPAEGVKGLEALSLGAGRAVLSSSQGSQPSYVRKDRTMSIFTYHLIEALTGHARPAEGATEVLVSDVMGHVWRRVPESAQQDWGAHQQPDYQVSGNFPVALLLGGKGLAKGVAAPNPLAPPAAAVPATVFDQRGQTVHGPQTNITGSVRGPVFSGQFGGPVAVGRGAQAYVQQGVTAELDRLFAPLVDLIRDLPPERRELAEQKVQDLKKEAAKGKAADDSRLAKLLDGLAVQAPAAASTVVSMFAAPVLSGLAGPVTKFVLSRLGGDHG